MNLHKFQKGEYVNYIKKNHYKQLAIIEEIHFDDAPNFYYTIKFFKNQKEIQTIESNLSKNFINIEKYFIKKN